MIRGINFKTKRSDTIFLLLHNSIDLEKYNWHIIENGAYKGETKEDVFKKEEYHGEEIKRIFEDKGNFVLYANIQAYTNNNKKEEIYDYNDFKLSKCECVILIYDSLFNEIYVKNVSILNKIKSEVDKQGLEEVEYITDENDSRTKFYVMR